MGLSNLNEIDCKLEKFGRLEKFIILPNPENKRLKRTWASGLTTTKIDGPYDFI